MTTATRTYGWSAIGRVFHEYGPPAFNAPVYEDGHGWRNTPCCGERWIDKQAPEEPRDRMPCAGLERYKLATYWVRVSPNVYVARQGY